MIRVADYQKVWGFKVRIQFSHDFRSVGNQQRWALVPGFAFLRSCLPGILGTQACGNANFIQDRGNAECERIGTLNLRSCK